jgi:hypothetical protein
MNRQRDIQHGVAHHAKRCDERKDDNVFLVFFGGVHETVFPVRQ